jgi:hypothetical protein
MKKIILLLLSVFLFSFSFADYKQDLTKYYSKQAVQKVETMLEKWNNKVLKSEDPIKTYNKVLAKIDNILKKQISEKIKIVVLFLKEEISNFKNQYEQNLKSKQENNNQVDA